MLLDIVGMRPCRITLSSSTDHQHSNTATYSSVILCFFLTSGYCKLLTKLLQMSTLISAPTKPIWLPRYQLFHEWVTKCHWDFSDFFPIQKPLSTGTVSNTVFALLFWYISSIFDNAASLCAWFCFLLTNKTVSGSPFFSDIPFHNELCQKDLFILHR